MANVLKMALIESILSLHAQRYSQRRFTRELGVDRETVPEYLPAVVRGKTSHCAGRLGRVKTSRSRPAGSRLKTSQQPADRLQRGAGG